MLDDVILSVDRQTLEKSIRRSILKGGWERDERILLRDAIDPSDRVLDLGSCIGTMAIAAAKVVGEENVLTYEANPAMESTIRQNFALNGFGHPQLVMKAVTGDGRAVTLNRGEEAISSSILKRASTPAQIAVESDRFSSILEAFQPTFLSMDVEGAEDELLHSVEGLGTVRKAMMELHPHVIGIDRVEACRERMTSFGFTRAVSKGDVSLFYGR